MAPSTSLLALRDTATAKNTTVSDSQQNGNSSSSSSSSNDSTTWVLIAIIVGLVGLIAISVFVILRMLRLRERRRLQQRQQQQTYGQDDDHHACDETGRLSPYLHATPPQQRKLSKLSEADRRSWGEHVEQEQRAMMIRKSLASRSAEFPGGRRQHSDSVSSSDSGSSFVDPSLEASRPATSSEAMLAAARGNSDVGVDQEKDDEEQQQFPAGGLRDDWKAFEAQLHLDKSLSRETHPAAAGRGVVNEQI
ncbi:hypothetical protein PspLS_09995 [Pyricularia sp. CBS 133598]|nr:hypothetical protein PspLS_09995 [Pyricularia sp. CBS 133598]